MLRQESITAKLTSGSLGQTDCIPMSRSHLLRRALVRAALRPNVWPRPSYDRLARCGRVGRAVRREAARRAWADRAWRDTVLRGSCLRTRDTAREMRGRRRVLRWLLTGGVGVGSALAGARLCLAFSRRAQANTCAPGFGEPDGNSLLR